MPDADQSGGPPSSDAIISSLPQDVQKALRATLNVDEAVSICLLADITEAGRFGERWTFLTDQRLLALAANGSPDNWNVVFEMPLEDIDDAHLNNYVTSSALIVSSRSKGHEVARFSFSGRHEGSSLCYCLQEIAAQRKKLGADAKLVLPPPPRRPLHRCSKCGRALRAQGEVCAHCLDRRRLIVRLLSYLYPYRGYAILALVLTFIMTALQLVPPYLTKILVDDVIAARNPGLLTVIIGLMIATFAGRAIVTAVRLYVMQWLGNRILFDLRLQVFDHLQMLRLSYYNQRQTGQIMSRATGDLPRLQQFIAQGFQDILINLVTMILIAGILLSLNWKLFLIALAPIPIIVVSTAFFGRRIHLLYHRIWRRMGTVAAILADTIPGIKVVKSFAQEERESDRFGMQSADLYHHQIQVARVSSIFYPFLDLMTGFGAILIFAAGGYMVLAGDTTLGVLMAFTVYLWQFYAPIQQFGSINDRLQTCATSAERVYEILDADVEPIQRTDGIALRPLKGKVEFRSVRFAYEPGKYALDNISFVARPGDMIGLVGPSGAGKSTLVSLIARFYDIDEGEILIDDHPIEDLDLRSFREQIGVVLQEPYLFHGSIWENIAYARRDASADEIIHAARAANAHDFIVNLPDGYDTVIAERGQTLSGGERQRLSIARAILRDPRILILDEATASVDTETEMMIQTALERLIHDRTTFAIAHRLSTLRMATKLVVIDRGKLAEIGTHEELAKTNGLYSRLCHYQNELARMTDW